MDLPAVLRLWPAPLLSDSLRARSQSPLVKVLATWLPVDQSPQKTDL